MFNRILITVIVFLSVVSGAVSVSAATKPRNPIVTLSLPVREEFACVMWAESRSTLMHPNLGDNNASGGSSGVFQIIASTWNEWAPRVGIHVPVWRASYYQQSLVAVEIWRNDGFGPWSGDSCFHRNANVYDAP